MSFTFNGMSSDDMYLVVEKAPNIRIPVRKVNTISIPGRNGDLHETTDAFENGTVEYPVYCKFGFLPNSLRGAWRTLMTSAINEMLLVPGYARLTDSYSIVNRFYFARIKNVSEITSQLNVTGRAKIVFDCMPMHYNTTDYDRMTIISPYGGTLRGVGEYSSFPLYEIDNSDQDGGTLTVGDVTITVAADAPKYIRIDTFTETIQGAATSDFADATYITAEDGVTMSAFPLLVPAGTYVIVAGGITAGVYERWWSL